MSESIVNASPPSEIAAAIRKVNQTPGLRISTGTKALWRIFQADGHSMKHSELDAEFGALDLHFGWFCRRVAEELGVADPDAFALCNSESNATGDKRLTLKPSVVAALRTKAKTSVS